jgi:hypothetical protein
MPLYYLHLRTTDRGLITDIEGAEFSDLDAARREALGSAIDLWGSYVQSGRDPSGYAFEVVGEDGSMCLRLPFSEALKEWTGR